MNRRDMDMKVDVSTGGDLVWAIMFLFFIFWLHGGWYRIDCALGVPRACELISSEKEYRVDLK